MQPGQHQAYVTVENTDQKAVRSTGFGFALAEVPKTNQNPLGLSLTLQKSDRSKLFYGYYVAAAIAVVGIALLVSLRIMRRRSLSKRYDDQAYEPTITDTSEDPHWGGRA
jgi:hypothetical protein